MRRSHRIAMLLSCFLLISVTCEPAFGQRSQQKQRGFPLLDFSQGTNCHEKGRLQDQGMCQAKVIDQIIAQGNEAIPILISQLTDTTQLKEPVFEFWNGPMTIGDLADAVLDDLFTNSDLRTFNMPGLERISPTCQDSAEACWRAVLKQHGRKFVHDQWLAAWNKNKDRIYWDSAARCFRLSLKS